jgi:2-C-methyl-D-erythritol 2,4-cyclodiphosphate synthase
MTYEGIDSRILLRDVFAKVQAEGYRLGNLDVTIIAQAPKMAPHIEGMRAVMAADLQSTIQQINVKATTSERLGFTGRKEGIAVEAVVLVVKA